ncbi:chorismate mutase [[Haemophilus] ducreyi]|uniref:chorismate mutase n=1 Tax=Haemophilus ducreyi TaxID=730 RepID=UPI000656378A|nr:chorismate mutase [[Haemophilus] ducreyi]AKO45285.1 chorismate mutase [[Haemophilus] ducreyi]AKO46687.1 chorismate mutase [[Haemophilus] ducreyi]AKO48028.1 chorismate mutase [[Haemophilus] ducreyi]AKO49415.1 chorismate mutase [[Haemophilus] ducreyi]ANF67795.1 bifunctional chorismate mutase/prephenate dehydratase [[Haemophilus] ducreyi]
MPLNLSNIRTQITQLDHDLLKLLAERHQLAFDVLRDKQITEIPLRDRTRETELLNALIKYAEAQKYDLDEEYITQIFQRIMKDSILTQQAYFKDNLKQERENNKKISIAFLGMAGSYSSMAAKQFAKKQQNVMIELNCNSFQEVFEKVEGDLAQFGILPLENSTSGSINEVYDILQHTNLTIIDEIVYPIKHCILANPTATLEDIDTIYMHPEHEKQCSQALEKLGKIDIKYCESSSHAMSLAACLNKPNIAALSGEAGGKLYDLTNIKTNITNQEHNITRFIIVAKKAVPVSPQLQTKILLLMTSKKQAGILVDVLSIFKQHKIRMLKLVSRPIYGEDWEEMFYVELEANIDSAKTQQTLAELQKITCYLKVVGCYPSEVVQPVQL